MAGSVDFYLNALGDEYSPSIPKAELHQYSPYQTDDIYCVDLKSVIKNSAGVILSTNEDKMQDFLAVQAYSITLIPCDFNKIAKDYP